MTAKRHAIGPGLPALAGLAFAAPALAALAGAPAAAQGLCRVADPTGTPLNVRAAPEGDVIGTLGNGRDVEILELRADGRGRGWALVRQPGAPAALGWVFRPYLSCAR